MVLDTWSADLSERLILFHFCQNKVETVETDFPLIKLAYGDIELQVSWIFSLLFWSWRVQPETHHCLQIISTLPWIHPLFALRDALEDLQLYLHTSGCDQHLILAKNIEISAEA